MAVGFHPRGSGHGTVRHLPFIASPFYPSLTTTLLRYGQTGDKDKDVEGGDGGARLEQDLLTEDEKRMGTTSEEAEDNFSSNVSDVDVSSYEDRDRKDAIVEARKAPTILEELRAVFSRPIYVLIALGYAAQTGALIGISTFGSAFLMGLGYFGSETEASSCFGVLVSLSGITGTLLGGYLLDRSILHYRTKATETKRDGDGERVSLTSSEEEAFASQELTRKEVELVQVRAATSMISMVSIGCALLMWVVYFVKQKELFMVIIGSGCALAFLATPGINIGAMNAVPVKNRAFCMAMMSVIIHAFGGCPFARHRRPPERSSCTTVQRCRCGIGPMSRGRSRPSLDNAYHLQLVLMVYCMLWTCEAYCRSRSQVEE